MNRILLALTILSAGAGGFLAARQSTIRLQHQATAAHEVWLAQTQLLADAQSEQAGLVERVRELKQALAQLPLPAESPIWSALQTNRADYLPPELRSGLREELGFHWQSSPDFIVVSKDAVRQVGMWAVRLDKLTDTAATVLAMTPEERGQVEKAIARVKTDFKDWVRAHSERSEPTDVVVAQYALPNDPAMSQSISNTFAAAVFTALGRERTEILLDSSQAWIASLLMPSEKPAKLIVKRQMAGNEVRLKVQWQELSGASYSGDLWHADARQLASFPKTFRTIFPNGWVDVAKREGFELPAESQKK